MAQINREQLYELLPAIYRERDAASGEALRALLSVVDGQVDLVEGDIRRLWDNLFVELCDPWVIPYIGDLVGTTPLFDESRVRQQDTARELFPDLRGPRLIPDVAIRARADVANTVYYRRRKGTLPMLEELARDVTGWGTHAVEFFELLGWTQYVRDHLRLHSEHGAALRHVERADRICSAFDDLSHTVDVRRINPLDGWHNIRNIGLFLWRLNSYEAEYVDARRLGAAGDYRYHTSPLGNDAPLFTRWRREGDETGLATELHVPGPIRPARLFEDLKAYRALPMPRPGFSEFYGLFDVLPGATLPQAPGASIMIVLHRGTTATPVPPELVRCMDLSGWSQPTADLVGIDVRRGRLALGPDRLLPAVAPDRVEVFYHYGFSADMGGGPYRRRAWLVRPRSGMERLTVSQSGAAGTFATITAALAEWTSRGKPDTIITIADSRTYTEALSIEPADGRWLALEAGDEVRPHLCLTAPLAFTGSHPDATVTLSGLLIEGTLHVEGELGRLRVLHSTLVPGGSIAQTDPPAAAPAAAPPSVLVAPGPAGDPRNEDMRLEIAFSIVGPLRVPEHAKGIWALDSIIDGVDTSAIAAPATVDQPGPPVWMERVTVLGRSFVKEIVYGSEVVFDAPVTAARTQSGCLRFGFVAQDSLTPRRYRCQPDLRIAAEVEQAETQAAAAGISFGDPERAEIATRVRTWLVPAYTSRGYGDPGYAQLHLSCPREIAAGAQDGAEMGAFCHLKQPQRVANLKLRLEEYLPFGLEAGFIYVT